MRQVLAVFWVSFAFLVVGTSPAHFWLDSGELAAAGAELGVMHPPGIPGFGLVLHASNLIPVGSLGFRMAALCGALGASAVAVLFALLRRHGAHAAVAWGVSFWVLAGWTFVRQARVVEVYALGAALLLATLWALDPAAPARYRQRYRVLAVLAATWAAWCFGDLRLALAPLVATLWLLDARRRQDWVRWAPLAVMVASLAVLALPTASAGAPQTDWGDPDSFAGLWDHLNARSIRAAYADEILPASALLWWHNLAGAMERLAQDLGPLGPALALACIVGLAIRRRTRHGLGLVILWVCLVELFYVVGINPMGGADRQTGIPLVLMAALAVGLVVGPWARDLRRLRWAVLPLLGTIVVLPAAFRSSTDAVKTRSWGPHAWTRAALGQLPPGALLLTQTDDLAAGVTAAMVLEGARPDIVTAPAQHLYRPMSEWAGARPRDRTLWTAAARETSEADRIEAAIAAHEGAVALEHPGVGLFGPVAWWSQLGQVPLGVAGPGVDPAAAAPIAGAEEIDRWLPRLSGREDRLRLAAAVANRARGQVLRRPHDAADAALALEDVIRRVMPDHPSTLVALAALYAGRNDFGRAIALTRAVLSVEPERNAALLNLALYLSQDPNTRAEAEAVAARAAKLRPWRVDVWRRLAQVREAAGDSEGAREAHERAQWAAAR